MLQIQRVFSPQIHNREPFATGWWRRERNCKLTFSRQASVVQRVQAYWMRFSVHSNLHVGFKIKAQIGDTCFNHRAVMGGVYLLEVADTRTQSKSNPSPLPNSLLTGKLTGNFADSGALRRFWRPVDERIQ